MPFIFILTCVHIFALLYFVSWHPCKNTNYQNALIHTCILYNTTRRCHYMTNAYRIAKYKKIAQIKHLISTSVYKNRSVQWCDRDVLELVAKPAGCCLKTAKFLIPAWEIIRWKLILAGREVIKIGCVSGTSYLNVVKQRILGHGGKTFCRICTLCRVKNMDMYNIYIVHASVSHEMVRTQFVRWK